MGISQQKMINVLVIHHDELVNYINARFGNRNFAMEVVQETCLRLLSKKSDDFDHVTAPLPLLKRISMHLAIDLYRRDQLIGQYFDHTAELSDVVEEVELEKFTLPELCLAKYQYEKMLLQAIKALPTVCQDVFILTQLYHLTQVETAEQLGISRGMVARHLGRALQSLIPVLFEQDDQ
ncbi:RNA polymerase sigma factor [Acinetobacter populi]|uniref:RNA polymerase sigma factor 70 region 4 type 2 domain-containing protein n=1 Tax=Acinetobacter populi TaxID=1582270 RepID=A0A1Z9YXV9_9GAMM|nr:RNA polymerase sigma factor [Acinetobacter populi]OUY07049.1 hypothetical protein CAP51_10185 [Acinetobacter populi]